MEILRWIADGCPDGVMEGTYHRITAGALRNRGLMTTAGKGPTWAAKATTAGREYLREVDGPNPAQAWNQADQLRRYCDALATAHGEDPNTAEWLEWAREYTARLDPLTTPPTMPDPPEETPEALQQHLPRGWSAHGPEHGHGTSYWS